MDTCTEAPTTRTFQNDIQYNLNVTFMDSLGTSWEIRDIEPNIKNPDYIPIYKFISLVKIEYEQEWTEWQKTNFDCHNKISPRKNTTLVIPISAIKGILTGYNCDGTYMCKIDCGRGDSKGGYVFSVSEPEDIDTISTTIKILCRLMK